MADNVLMTVDLHSVVRDPFPHVIVRDALPSQAYADLSGSFPLEGVMDSRRRAEGNVAIRLSARDVFNHNAISPNWRQFFAEHTSHDYWIELVRVFGDAIRAVHPTLEERIGKPLAEFDVGVRGTGGKRDISLECQFVINTPSSETLSVKTPHVDKRQTLLAGLFYMREADDTSAGGDLDFYTWKRAPRFLVNRMILPSDVTKVSTVGYDKNTLVCFVNSPTSVHGVSPRGPSSLPRRYINFIVETNFHLFRAPSVGPIARLQHWNDAKAIRHSSRFH